MNNKKILVGILSIVSAICLLAGCQLSSDKKFIDETKIVEYGTIYELDTVKTAKDGTEYEVQAEVFNSKNQPVAVFGGKFDVLDVNGYTVKYTVYQGEEKIGEYTTALNVDKNVNPVVKFTFYSQTNTFEIGEEFELPSSLAYSVVEESVAETKMLYKLNGEEKTEIEFSDGAFTPTEAGEYAYSVTAVDGNGKSSAVEYSFTIRQAPQETELESFNHTISIKNVQTKTGDVGFEDMRYCNDEIDGIVGSIKLTAKKNWPLFYLKPRQDINATEYPWISFKMYVETEGLEDVMKRVVGVYDAYNGEGRNSVVDCGQWVEVYTSTEKFLSSMEENGFGLLFSFNNDSANGQFRVNKEFTAYVADIRLAKSHTVSDETQLIDISKGDVLQNLHANYTYSWDYGFGMELSNAEVGGQAGNTLKLTAHNIDCSHPNLYVMPVQTLASYKAQGYTHVNIPLYIDGTTLPENRTIKKFSFWKVGGGADDMYLPVNTWNVVSRSLDDLFSHASNGYISLFQMDNSSDKDLNYVVYVGNIQATMLTPFHNYLEKCSATGVMFDGVPALKVTVQECNQTNMKLYCYTNGVTKQKMLDAGYTKVKFRMYIDSSTLSEQSKAKGIKEICVLPHTDGLEYEITEMPFDQWVEFEFDIDRFWKYYNDTYKLFAIFSSFNYNDADSNLYLDENFVVYVDGFYCL